MCRTHTRHSLRRHAGYGYSGPCAAWAYKALDLGAAKRVFVLGPSHRYYLRGCALSTFSHYATPFGTLRIDGATYETLRATGRFALIPRRYDVEEHSLEMHLPYLWKRLAQTFGTDDTAAWPPVVPILVGANDVDAEREVGKLLAPLLRDEHAAVVVSSDFCHWGSNFDYRPHCTAAHVEDVLQNHPARKLFDYAYSTAWETRREDEEPLPYPDPPDHPIHESIKELDDRAMAAVESGDHVAFVRLLERTKNTVCGRHPIGVVMAALEVLRDDGVLGDGKGRFKFTQYQRSNLVQDPGDTSVSYCAAYAVL